MYKHVVRYLSFQMNVDTRKDILQSYEEMKNTIHYLMEIFRDSIIQLQQNVK